MQIPKKYFEDRLALILSGASALVVILTILSLVLRASVGSGGSYIVSYRANLGIEAFRSGGLSGQISFIVFAVVILGLEMVLCWRVYLIERRLAIGVLAAGLFLLIMCLIVSNALLALH